MERGIYFDAWFPRQHCYHPSLPPRRLRMIEDLEAYRATALVWSALGGGSISLPYLEQEAWQKIDPRFRLYGFLNDAEFVRHCQERGIKVFGIVFEVQGWEFPAELTDGEDEILALNELRGAGKRGWVGLREFTQDRYPKLWKPFRHYFPEGLVNSAGEPVTDLLEECASRDIFAEACHSTWVECPDRDHYAYLMDRNNPVWREYLKAIIRIQIDAGVAGVQLDEADLPIFATGYGGCFCKDCMSLFREYLAALPPEELPKEVKDTDLQTFHYGSWLLERGYDFKANRETTPLYWDYIRFQRKTIVRYFGELADYIKEYGASQGREVLVSGNFYYFSPHYYAFEPKADILITEMDSTSYRQPSWCRYAAGFAGGKPVIVVENPYGGVPPELLPKLKAGKGHDLLRMMHYEAAALGINMSVPYGAWMGSVIEDSFWAPHELVTEIQDFLADHEEFYSTSTYSETAVAFSVPSSFGYLEEHGSGRPFPFWAVCDGLVTEKQPFDVIMFPDGTLREDSITTESLGQYRTLILPEASFLTRAQCAAVMGFLNRGGRILATGGLGLNLDEGARRELLAHPHLLRTTQVGAEDLAGGPQVICEGAPDLAINIHKIGDKQAAIHLIRYDYHEDRDEVPVLPKLVMQVRLARPFRMAKAFSPAGEVGVCMSISRDIREMHRVELHNVPLYCVVLLQG
jgi:hypothetical protein